MNTPVKHTQIKPRNLFKKVNEPTNTGNHPNRGEENKQYEQRRQRKNNLQLNDMNTPANHTQIKPNILFKNISEPDNIEVEGINLEFLLLNTLMINAVKVQTVLEDFVKGKTYNSIFCFTEIKVESLDFDPVGVKLFSKHRGKKDKKGGGLIIGHMKDNRIKLEEIEVKNNDILALEGTIRGNRIRIILTYFDSTKLKTGKYYERNRRIQKYI